MSRRQLFALFVCSLIPWTIGNGMAPLLPVHAAGLGATQAVAGYYLSFSYVALAAGTLVAGWLSDRFQRRKMLVVVVGWVSIPALALMGQATNIWTLAVYSAAWHFCAGMTMTLISIVAGLFAEGTERGKVFGMLGLTAELGSLIGGLVAGPTADTWGYPIMFALLSLFSALWPLTGLLLQEKVTTRARHEETASVGEGTGLGNSFYLLFLASLAAMVAGYVFYLGRTLVMDELGFGASAVSSTAAIGGAIALPFPLVVGWLSDRLGRKQFLTLSFLAGTLGLCALTASVCLWHFWLASLLFTLSFAGGAIGNALVTDLVPQGSLGRSLSLFGATTWIAGILGFAGTGYAVQCLGVIPTFAAGALLPLLAIVLLAPIQQSQKGRAPLCKFAT